jgi:hypothetical protein
MSSHVAALDSNVFTYFSDAMTFGYDPAADDPDLAEQRLAVLRGYIYGEAVYTALKSVVQEYRQIRDTQKREQHDEIACVLMLDGVPTPPKIDVDSRAARFLRYHSKAQDCRVLAEADALGVPYLLTFDQRFLKTLSCKADVTQLVTPAAYFATLGVQPGAPMKHSPKSENGLASLHWWKV